MLPSQTGFLTIEELYFISKEKFKFIDSFQPLTNVSNGSLSWMMQGSKLAFALF